MIGMLVFPAKPDAGYEFKKNPKQVFELDDSDVLAFSRGNKASNEFFHYLDDKDDLSDKEIIEYFSKLSTVRKLDDPKKSGKGYISGDKKWLIRVMKCDREWFRNRRY